MSTRGDTLRRVARSRGGAAGLALLLPAALCALLGPALAPHDPTGDFFAAAAGPSADHWLGTDPVGRDVLSRLLHATARSLSLAIAATALSTALGTLAGTAAGARDGGLDAAVRGLADTTVTVPRIVWMLAVFGLLRPSADAAPWLLVGLLGLTGWVPVARLVREEVRALRSAPVLDAARIAGLPPALRFRTVLLPALVPLVAVQGTIELGATLMTESGLSALGFGVPPPTPTWGALLGDATRLATRNPAGLVGPAVLLGLTIVGFHRLADGVAEATAPTATDGTPRAASDGPPAID